ncbi:zinc finger protein 862-like [Centruroides vittatus]|uniref:zinc finger protein 862-like n=1 Tax=Centruroides vittatus TaxID=120091 RepID=UPI00350EB7FB
MKHAKLSYLMQNGTAYYEKLKIEDICKKQKYSMIIDESTDILVSQTLAIVVRYFDHKRNDVKDVFFDIVLVENGTAQGLQNCIKSIFQERKVPLQNMIGFTSHNCATMVGNKTGLLTLLKQDFPSIFAIGCICHSFALCSSHVVKTFSSYLELFLKNITSYFARSSKRQNDFKMIQGVVNTSQHKIPKLSQTRWLSCENVINIILEQWDALKLYFQSEMQTNKIDGARGIYDILVNKGTKHTFVFLQYVLHKVNVLNTEFQSEHFRLHVLYSMISAEYRNILSMFIKEETLLTTNLSEIDPADVRNHQDVKKIFLGGRTMSLLETEPLSTITSM